VEARPEVDEATKGVPGAPKIFDALLAKLDHAEVVVCDISIVPHGKGENAAVRPAPNANVLIELGYALKSLGTTDRLILVMNTAYGGIEELPFDLRQFRPVMYCSREEDADRAEERKKLSNAIEATLRAVLSGPSRHEPAEADVEVFADFMLDPMDVAVDADGQTEWRKARLGVRLTVESRRPERLSGVALGVVFLSGDRLYATESRLPEWVSSAVRIERKPHHRVLQRTFDLGNVSPGGGKSTPWWEAWISMDATPWRAAIYVVAERAAPTWFGIEVSKDLTPLTPQPGQGVQVRSLALRRTPEPLVAVGDVPLDR
jgi:hypothetical protein